MASKCPVCKKHDAAQRVTTIVAAGQSSGTFSGPTGGVTYSDGKWGTVGGYTTLSGSTRSDRARSLAPPTRSRFRGWLQFGCGLYCLIWVAGLFWAVGSAGFSSSSSIFDFLGDLGSLFGATALPGILGLVILLNWNRKRVASEKIDEQYPRAMAKWQRLYFCHRDDVVFDPETNESFEPSQIKKYIYRPSSRPESTRKTSRAPTKRSSKSR